MRVITDSPISFPGLFGDWEFTASEVALPVGNGIYWYGIIIALGVLAAMALCLRLRNRFGMQEDHVLDIVLWGVPMSIIGARAYYVLFYQELYRGADGTFDWGAAIAIWDGGIAIYGAVIAALLTAVVYCRIKKLPLGAMTDMGVIGLLVGQCIGRWGNFMNREAFGAETALPWRMRLMLESGEFIEVHPTFLYESLWNLAGILLIVLVITPRRRFDGQNTWCYFLWYGLGRFWVEGLRTDSLYLFGWTFMGEPIRVSQALSAVMVGLSAAVLIYMLAVRKPDPAQMYVNRQNEIPENEEETEVEKETEPEAETEAEAETENETETNGEGEDA